MSLELAPFRFHGWLGNRKTESFGWRYDFDDAASRQPSRSRTGSGRCGTRRPPSRDWRLATSSMFCSRATIPEPGSAGTETAMFLNRWLVSHSTHPRSCDSDSGRKAGSAAPRSRHCRGRLTCFPAKAGGTGSIAFHPAPSCASRSRSARFPSAAGGKQRKRSGRSARRTRPVRALAQIMTASAFRNLQGTPRPSARPSKR